MSRFALRDVRGVDVVYWVPTDEEASEPAERVENLGDYLGSVIAAKVAGTRSGAGTGARLLTAGSILQAAEPGDVVWGSGLNLKLSRPIPPSASGLDYRAVRGPLTRAALLLAGADVPNVLGDPVSLLPEIFPDVRDWIDRRRSITIVPNLRDFPAFDDQPGVVSPIAETWSVVRAIAESELVVGSSLHAVIIAESMGIPARFLLSRVENPWKYHDYLLATGRSKERFARTVDEAVTLGGYPPPRLSLTALSSAFPYDLWGSGPTPNHAEPEEAAFTLDSVTDLLINEFEDVHRPDRGGLPMVQSLVRMFGAPLVLELGHRLRGDRLEPVAAALRHLIGDHIEALDLSGDAASEIVRTLAEGSHRPFARLSLRDAVGANARVVSVDLDADRFEWRFNGVGLGPSVLRTSTGARVVLLHDGDETPVAAQRLAVAVDYPDFRWSLSLRLTDIPSGVSHFGLRIDWETSCGWIRGPCVRRTAGVGEPRFLMLQGERDWRLGQEAIAARDELNIDVSDSSGGCENVRNSSAFAWLGAPTTLELTVVVTAHAVSEWLDETLYSIFRQDVPGMEVIVVNDHSEDEIDAVLDLFKDDARLVAINAIERGGANARDVGASVARGRFIAFADGDDLVPDGAYRALVDSLKRSGSDIAIGNFSKFSSSEIWRPSKRWNVFNNPGVAIRVRENPDLIQNRAVWNRVFRREFWSHAGLSFPEVASSNDIVPMTRALLLAKHVDVVDRDVYLHRERPGGTSMTSRSSSTDGLASYLSQELECVELVSEDGDPALIATMTALFVSTDGWATLQRAASQSDVLPLSIVPLVDAILAKLPPEIVARQPADRQAVVRLLALGRCAAATAILTHRADASDQDAIDLLNGWLEAIEFVPRLTPDDDGHTAWYTGYVRTALRQVASGFPGLEIRDAFRRALELQPADAFDPVASAVLQFAAQTETPDDFHTAMRLLAARPSACPGAPTVDDWLILLAEMGSLSHDQVRLIWLDRIGSLLDASLEGEVVITDDQWKRLVASRRSAVTKHRNRGVRRAAPIVAIYNDFGTGGLSAYRALRAHGVIVDQCVLRRDRLRLAGPLPVHVSAALLALHVQRGRETVATFPVTVNRVAGAWRWSTTIDLALVPLDGPSSAVFECFPGSEGWFYLRVPLHVTEQAASRSGGHLRATDSGRSAKLPAVSLTGVPGIRRLVRDVAAGARCVSRRTFRRLRQAVAPSRFPVRGR